MGETPTREALEAAQAELARAKRLVSELDLTLARLRQEAGKWGTRAKMMPSRVQHEPEGLGFIVGWILGLILGASLSYFLV